MVMQKISLEEYQSENLVQQNIEHLKQIFPEVFSEGKVNFETLRHLLGDKDVLEEGEEKYGLNWHGKKKARQAALTPSLGTLLPYPEESVNWENTQNLLIEGDNLEVLKLLQKSYTNKVKMIYIDPPYNSGGEFIYPDNFKENLDTYLEYTGQIDSEGNSQFSSLERQGRRHTAWLNMLYPRLKLARNFLRSDGVIFISIDDNEISNLKCLCDEIFGRENYLGTIVWKKKTNGNNVGHIPPVHDYILAYGKLAQEDSLYGFPITEEFIKKTYSNPDNDPRGPWTTSDLSANHVGPYFPITNPNTGDVYYPPKGRYWVFNEKDVLKKIDEGRIIFGRSGKTSPVQKKYLNERTTLRFKAESWWDNHGMNSDGTAEIAELLLPKVFEHPKPTVLLQHLVNIATRDDDLILDFFAGSGSLGHAVFKQNIIDTTNRRFLLVQLPEIVPITSLASKNGFKTISQLAITRLKSAIKSFGLDNNNEFNLGFKVFKLAQSNIQPWNPDSTDLETTLLESENHLIEGRTEQDILYELLLKRGIDLATPIAERKVGEKIIYSIGYGATFACLDQNIQAGDIESIAQLIIDWYQELAPGNKPHIFFRDSAFENDVVKTNIAAILQQNGLDHVRSL